MAFFINVSGITSFSDVKASIETYCQSNGWTLSSGWLSKGDVSIRLTPQSGTGYTELKLESRTPDLDLCPRECYMRVTTFSGINANIDIHIHDNPDTVWVAMNMNTDLYAHMGFGFMHKTTPWKGGTWIFGSQCDKKRHVANIATRNSASFTRGGSVTPTVPSMVTQFDGDAHTFNCMPFWENGEVGQANTFHKLANNFIHCELRGRIWEYDAYNSADTGTNNLIKCPSLLKPLYSIGVNTYNSQTLLHPFILGLFNASEKIVPIGYPEHVRYVYMVNTLPGDVVNIASVEWKVYPANKRDPLYPQGSYTIGAPTTYYGSTGYLGIAIRKA